MKMMRPLLALMIVTALLSLTALVFSSASFATEAVMVLDDPITDNYKASYNANPDVPELRTWLALNSITVDGKRWRPFAPNQITIHPNGTVKLTRGDGLSAQLIAAVMAGPMTKPLLQRVDSLDAPSKGRWGPLGTLTSRAALKDTPVVISLKLISDSDQSVLATGMISYRYDANLASVGPQHIEYNGPGGRWFVGNTRTRTQEEAAPDKSSSIPAVITTQPNTQPPRPRITRIIMPTRAAKRSVSLRILGQRTSSARITHMRVRINHYRWGRWLPIRQHYRLILPQRKGIYTVRFQLRDSSRATSPLAQRRIRRI